MQIDIQTRKFALTRALKKRIQQRLGFALDINNAHIQRVKVRLSDINGPRGGEDKCCHIQIGLPNSSDVVVKEVKGDFFSAIDRAAHRASQAVRRKLVRVQHRGRQMTKVQARSWLAVPQPDYS